MPFLTRLIFWLSPPASQSTSQRLSLDSYGSKTMQTNQAKAEKRRDLESQESSQDRAMAIKTSHTKSPSKSDVPHADQPSGSMLARLKAWKPSKEILYNAVLGTSDGMTVPFAVTASLAGVADAKIVMLAGLSELIAGGVSMAAGGVLGARSDVQKYTVARQKLTSRLLSHPLEKEALITDTFTPYLPPHLTASLATHVSTLPTEDQLDFLLRFTPFYNDSDPPTTAGAWKIAFVLALGYFS
ncbi:MAG: hypothetical protein Q9164_005145, partial [Protoblastenia rupestris]